MWTGPLGMGRAKFEGNEKLSCQWAWEEIERTGWWHICTQFNRSYMWEIYLYISPFSLFLSLSLSLSLLHRRHTLSLSHISKIILYLLLYRPFLLCSFSSLSQSTHDNTRICLIIILPSLVTKLWWYYISLWPLQQNFFNT